MKKTKKINEVVRSSRISTKYINKHKLTKLLELYTIGKNLTKEYLELIWNMETGKYAESDLYRLNDSNLTARFKQLCCKKALDIKNSITEKINKKLFILDKIDEEIEKIEDLDIVHNKLNIKERINKTINKIDKIPEITNFNLELNGNFVNIKLNEHKKLTKTWINLSSLSKQYNMKLPFIKTKHFNKFDKDKRFKLSKFIQIYEDGSIKMVFKSKILLKSEGDDIGCDIGLNKVYSFNNGTQSSNDANDNNLVTIIGNICKTKNGSCGNKRKRTFRDNYTREAINLIDFTNIKTLYIEDIKYMRYKRKKVSRFLRSWTYTTIFSKLKSICEINGVNVISVAPTNTSRRCHSCGWTCIDNRNKENFKCNKCDYKCNSDINAAKNILFIKDKKIINGDSKLGFYFN